MLHFVYYEVTLRGGGNGSGYSPQSYVFFVLPLHAPFVRRRHVVARGDG